jgi:hypothetical protein
MFLSLLQAAIAALALLEAEVPTANIGPLAEPGG